MLSLLALVWAWCARKFAAELQLLREIYRRLSTPKPRFWKRVQKRAAVTATGLTGMVGSGHAPESVLPWLKGAALVMAGMAVAAQLPCLDGSETSTDTDTSASA